MKFSISGGPTQIGGTGEGGGGGRGRREGGRGGEAGVGAGGAGDGRARRRGEHERGPRRRRGGRLDLDRRCKNPFIIHHRVFTPKTLALSFTAAAPPSSAEFCILTGRFYFRDIFIRGK